MNRRIIESTWKWCEQRNRKFEQLVVTELRRWVIKLSTLTYENLTTIIKII